MHVVGILDGVEGHQLVHGEAIAPGDGGKALALAHHVLSGLWGVAEGGWFGRCGGSALQLEHLARLHMIGVFQAVEGHQGAHRHPMAIGDG